MRDVAICRNDVVNCPTSFLDWAAADVIGCRSPARRLLFWELHSSNGRIDVDHVTGAVDAKTSNGRIDCSVQAIQAPIRLKTNNGKIDLHVDERPEDVTIRAKSRNGKVDVLGERSKECVFGDGSIEVKLTSSNGSVTVSG